MPVLKKRELLFRKKVDMLVRRMQVRIEREKEQPRAQLYLIIRIPSSVLPDSGWEYTP